MVPVYPLDDEFSFEERLVRYNWQALVNRDTVERLGPILGDADRFFLVSSTPHTEEDDVVKAWIWEQGWRLTERRQWPGFGDPELLLFER